MKLCGAGDTWWITARRFFRCLFSTVGNENQVQTERECKRGCKDVGARERGGGVSFPRRPFCLHFSETKKQQGNKQLSPDLFSFLSSDRRPQKCGFATRLPGNCTHFITGVNKVNKRQAAKSWPHRLPPASPQRLPHSFKPPVQPLKQSRGQSYTTWPTACWCHSRPTVCPELDVIYSSHICCPCTSAKSIRFFFLFSQQIHPRKA